MRYTLGFIGAGNMAEAIARGAIGRGVIPANQLLAADPSDARLALFESFGVSRASSNAQVIAECEQVMLAVKPQTLPTLGETLSKLDIDRQVIISIMAGQGSAKIEAVVGQPARIVRVMPNTPLMASQGMSGIAPGSHAKPGDESLAMQIFGACGQAILVSEADLDAVTAVSGSGPAYLFYLAEAMQEAAEELGLSQHARLLVNQTLLGSATLLAQSTDTPAELRRKVTSPGGTTQAAIEHLDAHQIKHHITAALHKAAQRSIELGR